MFLITIVEEDHAVEMSEVKCETQVEEDPSMVVGYSEIVQAGENGQSLITKKIKRENGAIVDVVNVTSEVVKPAINRIVKTGSRTVFLMGSSNWAWPTKSGYTLSDGYAWRWGKMHSAQDIAGLGCNSPIYAVNDGTVVVSYYQYSLGNYVEIDHHNGYKTGYAHLSKMYVKEGQGVTMGTIIGLMGDTGESYGCHLHFIVEYNGVRINPLTLYQ